MKNEALQITDDQQQQAGISNAGEQEDIDVSQDLQSNVLPDSQAKTKVESWRQAAYTPEFLSWRKPLESTRVDTNPPDTERSLPSIDLSNDHINDELHDAASFDDYDDDTSSLATQESGPTLVVSKTRSKYFILIPTSGKHYPASRGFFLWEI